MIGARRVGAADSRNLLRSARAGTVVRGPSAGNAELGTKSLPKQVDPGLDVAYPVTYYGDTSDADSATPIQLRGGDRVEADVTLGLCRHCMCCSAFQTEAPMAPSSRVLGSRFR